MILIGHASPPTFILHTKSTELEHKTGMNLYKSRALITVLSLSLKCDFDIDVQCVCVWGGEGEKLFVGIMVAVEFERLHPLAERET